VSSDTNFISIRRTFNERIGPQRRSPMIERSRKGLAQGG